MYISEKNAFSDINDVSIYGKIHLNSKQIIHGKNLKLWPGVFISG